LKEDPFTIPFQVEAYKTRRIVMRVYIITAALLLSFTTLSVTKAEADFEPRGITPGAMDALMEGVNKGTFWTSPNPVDDSRGAHQLNSIMNEVRPPIETTQGLHEWLSPVEAINYAAAGVALDQPLHGTNKMSPFSSTSKFVSAPLMASVDPNGEFVRQVREGLFVVTPDYDSPQAHQLLTAYNQYMNHQGEAPNSYLVLTEQTGLGNLDKMFSVTSYGTHLQAIDPDHNFQRVARFTPEVGVAPQDTSFMGRVKAFLNAITSQFKGTPDTPFGIDVDEVE
jgi:hypothetical protein